MKARATRSGRHPSEVGRPCPVGLDQTPSSQVGSRGAARWPRKGPRNTTTRLSAATTRRSRVRAGAARYRHPDRCLPGRPGGSHDRRLRGPTNARRSRHADRAGGPLGPAPAVRDPARQVHRAPARPRPDHRQRHAHRAPRAGCARLEGAGLDRLAAALRRPQRTAARSAAWTEDAAWLPADEDAIELRYRDPTRMGKIYVVPPGVTRPAAGWDELGPDADDPSSTWPRGEPGSSAIRRAQEPAARQSFVAGIGNGYSDEILWAARLAPFRKRSTLAPEEVDALYDATRGRPSPGPSTSSGTGCHRASRSRCGTSCTCIGRAASHVPAAARRISEIVPGRLRHHASAAAASADRRARVWPRVISSRGRITLTRAAIMCRLPHGAGALREAQDLARPETARVTDVVETLDDGDGRAEARGDPAQRVAGLDLVASSGCGLRGRLRVWPGAALGTDWASTCAGNDGEAGNVASAAVGDARAAGAVAPGLAPKAVSRRPRPRSARQGAGLQRRSCRRPARCRARRRLPPNNESGPAMALGRSSATGATRGTRRATRASNATSPSGEPSQRARRAHGRRLEPRTGREGRQAQASLSRQAGRVDR